MNISFFGASSDRISSVYTDAAYDLGCKLAKRGHTLVYGAGGYGLMGAVARGATDNGGRVIGYSPKFFKEMGVLYDGCTELHYTDDMRQRKKAMEDNSDAVIMMPGSIGTYEEFFEILTLKQLGRIDKPIVALNVNGYFRELDALMRKAVDEEFLDRENLELFRIVDSVEEALSYIEAYKRKEQEN